MTDETFVSVSDQYDQAYGQCSIENILPEFHFPVFIYRVKLLFRLPSVCFIQLSMGVRKLFINFCSPSSDPAPQSPICFLVACIRSSHRTIGTPAPIRS